MGRSLYCSVDTLEQICQDKSNWRYQVLSQMQPIYVKTDQETPLPSTEDEYIKGFDACSDSFGSPYLIFDNLRERLGGIELSTFTDLEVDISNNANDTIYEDVLSDNSVLREGIAYIKNEDYRDLTRHWHEVTVKNQKYTWKDFFKADKNPIPTSNSVLIMDRYLFNTPAKVINGYLRGARNLLDILNSIIPSDYIGQYNVLVVFDDKTVEQDHDTLTGVSVEDAINDICGFLYRRLTHKKCSLCLEFICIRDSLFTKGCGPNDKDLHALYALTHDRRIITNYYSIQASHALNVSDEKKCSIDDQIIILESILSGVDNPDQEIRHIPLFSDVQYLNSFVGQLRKVSSSSCKCFYTDSDHTKPLRVEPKDLCNRILKLSKYCIDTLH